MRKVSQAMPRNWLFFAIDPGKVKIMTHVLLYQRSSAVMAFDAWLRAEQGDPSGLALMSAAYDLMISKIFVWGDLLAKGGSADFDSGRDYQDLVAPGSIIGSPMSLLIWQPASLAWPIKPISEEFRRVQRTDVETLLINGSIDFSTPVQYGRQELLPSLAKGSLVTLAEFGHVGDFWKIRPQAADRLLTSFYASGKADDSLFGYVPMNFKVPVTFSLIFKVAVATGLGLIMLAALLLVLFIRRKRNKAVLKNEQGVAHG
jgi:pimeloyl-ACP methyl ester carboxylesterase